MAHYKHLLMNGERCTDFVGIGDTPQEAEDRLRELWVTDLLERNDNEIEQRVADSWFDDILSGDDAEYTIETGEVE